MSKYSCTCLLCMHCYPCNTRQTGVGGGLAWTAEARVSPQPSESLKRLNYICCSSGKGAHHIVICAKVNFQFVCLWRFFCVCVCMIMFWGLNFAACLLLRCGPDVCTWIGKSQCESVHLGSWLCLASPERLFSLQSQCVQAMQSDADSSDQCQGSAGEGGWFRFGIGGRRRLQLQSAQPLIGCTHCFVHLSLCLFALLVCCFLYYSTSTTMTVLLVLLPLKLHP